MIIQKNLESIAIFKNRKTYSTLEFIEELTSELRRQPETLAKYFPNRVLKYTNWDLSLLWGRNIQYIQTIVNRIIQT
jgi:hypothetical protein